MINLYLPHAAAALQSQAERAENNAPIHRAEGNAAQADLDEAVAKDCRAALGLLVLEPGL